MTDARPPRCSSPREHAILRRMCTRADVEFTEWECARLLTEFKRNLSEAQWASLRDHARVESPEDALEALILFGFENRRLKRLRLRGRGRDRVFAEASHKRKMSRLLNQSRRGRS